MNKNTKSLIAIGVGLVGVYFVLKYFRGKKNQPIAEQTSSPRVSSGSSRGATTQPTRNNNSINQTYPIKRGSKGSGVRALQELILRIDPKLLPKFGADGDFGSETEAAVNRLLGKKSVDNANDYGRLLSMFNNKRFPLVTPKPQNTNAGVPFFRPPF